MRLDEGTYKAAELLTIHLMRSNSIGSTFYTPTEVSFRAIQAGETFDVPFTSNGHYYRTDGKADLIALAAK